MKKIIILIAMCSIITGCFTGCTTLGQFDPVKTEKVRASIKPIVSTAVRVWLASEPNPAYHLAAKGFADVICEMRDTKVFESKILVQRLNGELNKHGLINDLWAATAKDLIVSQFEIFIADRVRADLPPDEFAWNLLDVLCDGIRSGIGEAVFNRSLEELYFL